MWFDGIDEDVSVWGGTRRSYREWLFLDAMAQVLAEITETLDAMLRERHRPGRRLRQR
ncbi:hypothetical protein [Litorihabitans aurantiacus]|uniref:Uncharacterized protein n=1 Tax=Litorihabitans aurantiacus TaxID=1930061 RepID=A0AA38CWC6_9MICO|nr:hypothetical protein [Litorihabitans aurantiacus]GMA32982.1 hypothetical protein GCM10025875_29740 [Litorihabitans aurantiacus]